MSNLKLKGQTKYHPLYVEANMKMEFMAVFKETEELCVPDE